MKIISDKNNGTLTLRVEGRLDTTTAPQLEKELGGALAGVSRLVLDLEKLEYISSAGLRVLLSTLKIMNKQGEMCLTGVTESVREVLDITGFSDILTIR